MTKHFSAASSEAEIFQQRQEYIREQEHREASLDEALGFTFPASDPVALDCSVDSGVNSKPECVRTTIDFFKQVWARNRP